MNIRRLKEMLDNAAVGIGEEAEVVLVDEMGLRYGLSDGLWRVWGGEDSKVKIPIRAYLNGPGKMIPAKKTPAKKGRVWE